MSEFDATSKRSYLQPRTLTGKYKYGLPGLVCLVIVVAFATTQLRKDVINLPESVSQAASEEMRREFV